MCHNKESKYFAYLENKIYCRKCILLSKGKKAIKCQYEHKKQIKANLDYSLTKTQ